MHEIYIFIEDIHEFYILSGDIHEFYIFIKEIYDFFIFLKEFKNDKVGPSNASGVDVEHVLDGCWVCMG